MRSLTIRLTEDPGLTLYRQVKAGMTLKGLTFAEGCEQVGVKRENARRALYGLWNGPKADKVRERLFMVAGFEMLEG